MNTQEEFDVNEHSFLIHTMVEAIQYLPVRTFISNRLESGITISIYKDPKSKVRWQYKLPGQKFSSQKEILL
jgi:hypothetical protein